MRAETGPMQFEDDWPGIFIRGDSAFGLAMHLKRIAQRLRIKEGAGELPSAQFDIKYLDSVVKMLLSCDVRNAPIEGLQHATLSVSETPSKETP